MVRILLLIIYYENYYFLYEKGKGHNSRESVIFQIIADKFFLNRCSVFFGKSFKRIFGIAFNQNKGRFSKIVLNNFNCPHFDLFWCKFRQIRLNVLDPRAGGHKDIHKYIQTFSKNLTSSSGYPKMDIFTENSKPIFSAITILSLY